MSDITLTTGIRQNLLSLQQTSNDLTTTQEALATGKKVNSAADNPSSYFTSQNLTDTANSLSALLDQIGQGSQTINAATDGLTGITSLLQQALSTAQQAQSASWTVAATATGSTSLAATPNVTLAAGTLTIDVGSSTYSVTIAASATLSQIEADINGTTGLGSNGVVTATDDGAGHLLLNANEPPIGFTVGASAISAALGITTNSTTNNVAIGSSSTRGTLQSNFNGLLTQINQLAADSGYNGINLLAGDNLTIDFNPTGTSALTITGVTFNSAGLGLSAVSGTAATSFQSDTQLATTVASLNAALATVQSQTETFGTNASTITTRQTFETALINTLQTGATNLVVADQNQESADLLTEQTQQQLEISALSIANDANQSVLKLFS
ncbi:MAG TPA: flagellin [Xanthobacteraceae bacterium]|jgi:flagellin|nr:flagellin [Xanthobacteraceae bacterium]